MDRKLQRLTTRITACRRCPRLVAWRENVAREKVRRFADQDYWGRPVAGFGDPRARLLLVGLAPAAHGANRTGRMFTGDRSGDWLYRALHKAGFANQPTATSRSDGLELSDCYITAAARCAPPGNKPAREEFENCHGFLVEEMRLLTRIRVVLGLGKIGFDHAYGALCETRGLTPREKPPFSHGAEFQLDENLWLLGAFHPSQQNTFTGRLTEPMFDAVFQKARRTLTACSES